MRYTKRCLKQIRSKVTQAFAKEEKQATDKLIQAKCLAEHAIKYKYGFTPDPSVSSFRNAVRLEAASESTKLSLPLPTNLAFHDLTKNKIVSQGFKAVFGMGNKFIVTPKFTTGDIRAPRSRFRRE
jgi:hypothetical protein